MTVETPVMLFPRRRESTRFSEIRERVPTHRTPMRGHVPRPAAGGMRPELVFMIGLSDTTLHELPETIARPASDRASLTPGIVHVGLGNFHRAHQAWYLHRLFELGFDHDWAIIGAGVRPNDASQREKLLRQDCVRRDELSAGLRRRRGIVRRLNCSEQEIL